VAVLLVGACAALAWLGANPAAAQPINPQAFKKQFEEAKKDAEVVAVVRALAASCTAIMGEGKARSVTLEVALQVVQSEKGAVKQGDILVVAHTVNLPAGLAPACTAGWERSGAFRSPPACGARWPCGGTPSAAVTRPSRAGWKRRT